MNSPVQFVGTPDGPERFISEFGCAVKTFTQEPGGKMPALKWHVPPTMRGDFRPQDLANYDPAKNYRVDATGKVLCYAINKSGTRCSNKAQNRFPRCTLHGGRLHPLDKFVRSDDENETENQSLSRYRQFMAGQIGTDDLDDEELACCGFRAKNGRIYRPRNIPREMAQAFNRAIYERAQKELRRHVTDAAKTIAEIMMDKTNDASIRLKAAESLIERNLGKTPQVISVTAQAPWEEIFSDITGGSREEFRSKRIPIESAIDAEIVEIGSEGDERYSNSETDELHDGSNAHADKSPEQEFSAENAGDNKRSEKYNSNYDGRDSRLYERNEAVLAQTLESPRRRVTASDF